MLRYWYGVCQPIGLWSVLQTWWAMIIIEMNELVLNHHQPLPTVAVNHVSTCIINHHQPLSTVCINHYQPLPSSVINRNDQPLSSTTNQPRPLFLGAPHRTWVVRAPGERRREALSAEIAATRYAMEESTQRRWWWSNAGPVVDCCWSNEWLMNRWLVHEWLMNGWDGKFMVEWLTNGWWLTKDDRWSIVANEWSVNIPINHPKFHHSWCFPSRQGWFIDIWIYQQ